MHGKFQAFPLVVVFLFPTNVTAVHRYNNMQKHIARGHQRSHKAHRTGGRKGWTDNISPNSSGALWRGLKNLIW